MKNILHNILKPNSTREDDRRKEFILNILILGMIILCLITFSLSLFWYLTNPSASSPFIILFMLFFSIFLLFLSKKGFYKIASYLLVGIYALANIATIMASGIDVPQSLLLFALIIILSGILIGNKFSIIITILEAIILLSITYLHSHNIVSVDRAWRATLPSFIDAVVFSITLAIITIVSWISNNEINKSLKRALESEQALEKEKDSLKDKVEKRTKELKKAQLEQLIQLEQFSEIGKMASGIVHDLANPLTSINLCLTDAKNKRFNIGETKELLEQAFLSSKKITEYIDLVKKQMAMNYVKTTFDITKEISDVVQLLKYRLNTENVNLNFLQHSPINLTGSPLKLSQVISNLVNNSIDAFESNQEFKNITIKLSENEKQIILEFSDNGKGIDSKIKDRIFDPYFTTKESGRGMGLGLSIVKDIIEKDFKGRINLDTNIDNSTIFSITLPKNA